MQYSDLPGSHLPLTEAAVQQSNHWCRNPWEAAAAENHRCCFVGIYPASGGRVPVLVVWAVAAWDTLLFAAVGRVPFPVGLVFAAVVVCIDPASGFCGSCHRVVEYTGYTWRSPGKGKINTLAAKKRRGDPRHFGSTHGIFQLLNPLVA